MRDGPERKWKFVLLILPPCRNLHNAMTYLFDVNLLQLSIMNGESVLICNVRTFSMAFFICSYYTFGFSNYIIICTGCPKKMSPLEPS